MKKGDERRNWTNRWFVLKQGWLGYFKKQGVFATERKKNLVSLSCYEL